MEKRTNPSGRGGVVALRIFTTVALCVFIIFVSFLVTMDMNISVLPIPVYQPLPPRPEPRRFPVVNKTILLYNDFFGSAYWSLGEGDQIFRTLNCPVSDCVLSADKTVYNDSSAVVFHVPRMSRSVPQSRPPGQVWIFYAWESPINVKMPESWRRQFNWSLTYHRDSDYFMPFGKFERRREPLKRNWTAVVAKKTKAVAWFVSNCQSQSKRKDYINRLAKIISVDVWGGCGQNKCGYTERERCMSIINETYKFYLGFENSFCEDYVSEKLFRYSMYDVVVVVRGAGNYTQHAPRSAFINTADYNSPEELGVYLKYLDQNTTAYIKHLEWKENYVAKEYGLKQTIWCDICRDLSNTSSRKTNIDPYDLWLDTKRCRNPTDI